MITIRAKIQSYPPTANKIWRNWKGKMLLSCEARDFYRAGVFHVKQVAAARTVINQGGYPGAVTIRLDFYPKQRGRWDLDNRLKPMLDLLTKAGVWGDDSQVMKITAVKHEYDPECAGVVCLEIVDIE